MKRCRVLVIAAIAVGSWAARADDAVLVDVLNKTLEHNQEVVAASYTVDTARADVLLLTSVLDTQLVGQTGLRHTSSPLVVARQTDATASFSVSRRFSFGTTVDLSLQAARGIAVARTLQPLVLDSALATVTVTHSLLRNILDRDVVTATELGVTIAQENYLHIKNIALLNAVQAYWGHRVSALQVDVLKDAERRAEQLLKDTEILVASDQLPAAELLQLRANVTDKSRARRDAEHALFAAGTRLATAMGESRLEPASTTAWAAFPAMRTGLDVDTFLKDVDLRRRDARAVLIQRDAAADLLHFADRNLLPTVDFVGSLGLAAGRANVDAVGNVVDVVDIGRGDKIDTGTIAAVGLVFALPAENSASRGQAAAARAQWFTADVGYRRIQRDIEAAVLVAFDELQTAGVIRDAAQRGVQQSRTALDNERIKRKVGSATGIDVVLLEDRLTFAMLESALADARYATAWAELQFEAGHLDIGTSTTAALAVDLAEAGAVTK